MLVLMTASVCVLSAGVGAAEDVNTRLDFTLNEIYEETENKDVLYLENQYRIRIKDINKDVSPYKIRFALEKNGVILDDKILETGQEYSWNNNEDYITLNVEIFVGTNMDVVFFKNVYQISDGNTIIDNENFTLIYSGGISGSLNLNTADKSNIEGFTTLNENVLQSSSFPPASGYSQEFLKENYRLTLIDIDVNGNEAWISLSKNGGEVDNKVVSVGESYNYNSLLSFKLDKVFLGTSSNYVEIIDIYQYSELDSSVLVQNESALLLAGLTGKFILTGGGLEWQLEENYTLHAIDIDIAGYSRKAMFLITKDGTYVDYTILNVSDSYTYYKNENLIITADLEMVFSGESGVSMARLHHVYQYSEDKGKRLLNDAIHLFSVGNAREVEWQLDQDYSLSVMDIDSKDTPRQVWLRLNKDGNTLEDKFVHSEDSVIFYNRGTKILDLNVGTIFDGKEADLVFISDVYQYSKTNKKDILIENESHLFIFGSATGNDWQLYENYTVSYMDIDIKKYPSQVWLRMKKNGVPIDDNVVAQNEDYKYYSNSALLFEGYIKSAFGGRYLDILTLTNANQYSEFYSTSLITDATYTFYPENVEILMELNENLSLDENYTIFPVDIQGYYYQKNQSLWLRLYKDDVMVDEVILLKGQDYSYYSGNIKIISTNLARIFMGTNVDLIKFEDFYQYSEVDGSLLKYYDNLLLGLGRFTAPNVIETSPANEEVNVEIDTNITVTFSEPMNGSTLNNNTVKVYIQEKITGETLEDAVGIWNSIKTETPVVGDISYNSSSRTVTFDPVSNLNENTDYFPLITTGAEDLAGNGLTEDYVWTFRTIDATPPEINSVTLDTTTPIVGDEILVTVNTTDNNAVTNVTANGIALYQQNENIWNGTITAMGGPHFVNVSSRDAAGNVVWNNFTSYTSISANVIFIITNNNTNSSIEGATVALHNIKNETDVYGTAVFTNVAFGDYKYQVRMIGYKRTTGIISVNNYTEEKIKLVPKK